MAKESAKKVDDVPTREEFYYTKEGFVVFTREYHLSRGYCCKSACRHCPYDYKRKDG